MINNNKTDAGNIGSVLPFELLANNQRLFGSYYAEETEQLQSILEGNLKRHRRVIRLYRCFVCDQNRTAQKMSNCLAVCRECYSTAQGKGKIAKQNFVERTLNNFHKFLRRRVEL